MDARVINEDKLEAFVERAFGELSAGYAGVLISIGHKLGLFKTMAGAGRMTSEQVADAAGCSHRYVQEWLNIQAAGGYVDYYANDGTYQLSPEQALVLADEGSAVFLPNAWQIPASMWFDEEQAIAAIRTGDGVPWGSHSDRLYCGVAAIFRNAYVANLVQEWLPALDGVVAKLRAGARVADIGCGHGHSTLLMAAAFENSIFHGFEPHDGSLKIAESLAEDAGLEERVLFQTGKADGYPRLGYDLICFFDCLHDMGDPLAALKHAVTAMADDGTLLLIEPAAEDRVEDNFNATSRMYYAASTVLCCAHAISERGPVVLGAQAGQSRLRSLCRAAGLTQFRVAARTPFNMVLEVRK